MEDAEAVLGTLSGAVFLPDSLGLVGTSVIGAFPSGAGFSTNGDTLLPRYEIAGPKSFGTTSSFVDGTPEGNPTPLHLVDGDGIFAVGSLLEDPCQASALSLIEAGLPLQSAFLFSGTNFATMGLTPGDEFVL